MDDVNHMLAWIAVQGLSPDKALAAVEREITGDAETREKPGWPDLERKDYWDRIFMGQLPGNWLLLFGNLDEEQKELIDTLAAFGPASPEIYPHRVLCRRAGLCRWGGNLERRLRL